jgi:N-dimethylarginine dimethylaminohydrolase
MDLDQALAIVNDRALVAYGDATHQRVFRRYGEYEPGIDPEYDRIAFAYAFVSVEVAMEDGLLRYDASQSD